MMSFSVTGSHGFPPTRRSGGFTLIEAMMVTVIIGVGVMGMLQLLAAGTMVNGESTELTTAVNLANNINELTFRLPYNQLRTVASSTGREYTPPIDGIGNNLTDYSDWSQIVTVRYVDPTNLGFPVPETQVEPTSRITVTVKRNGITTYSTSWLVTASTH